MYESSAAPDMMWAVESRQPLDVSHGRAAIGSSGRVHAVCTDGMCPPLPNTHRVTLSDAIQFAKFKLNTHAFEHARLQDTLCHKLGRDYMEWD
eukprot:m.234737 g.234737  ORF g.234737 m.234737 type:complete len:93 (+) comp26133_c0_seq4:3798-4076(+)